jgi:hypothetical protein
MAEETLLSAARRVLRYFRIDEAHGGLTSPDTLIAMDTLALQVEKESERQSAQAVASPQSGAERPS